MKMLNGHRNIISSFDVSTNGQWFVTVDLGKESTIIVWENVNGTPIYSVFSPFKSGISIVKFSIDSKYLITVATVNNVQSVALWNWTFGADDPIIIIELDDNIGPIEQISCCPNRSNFFCLTSKKSVIFLTAVIEKHNALIVQIPTEKGQKNYEYTQSTYLNNFRQVLSATTRGLVAVWDDYDYGSIEAHNNRPVTNKKRLLKTVQLQNHSIITIICHKLIITGNINGDIFFYDKSLRVLFHLTKFVGDGIMSIEILTPIDLCKETDTSNENLFNNQTIQNKCKTDKVNNKCSTTASESYFKFAPFIISTVSGKIIYIDISQQNYTQIRESCDGVITSMTIHPEQPYIVYGNSVGRLNMYNYQTKQFLISNLSSSETIYSFGRQFTCIQYSPKGFYFCCGTEDGSLWFLDPCLLTPAILKPFKWTDTPIRCITFSPSTSKCDSSKYVVYTDGSFGLYLYSMIPGEQLKVKYHGCYQAHTNEIRGIVIVEDDDNLIIYSAGADLRIIVFKFNKQLNEYMELLKIIQTEPWSEPLCMVRSTIKKELNLIISGKDLHLYVWDENRCIRTTNGVKLKTPIRLLKESQKSNKILFFGSDTVIGMLRQPIDGNPYSYTAVIGSPSKMLDINVCPKSNYLFSINEDCSSVFMWSINYNSLKRSERIGGTSLVAFESLLDGGLNGTELAQLKEYFYCVQLVTSSKPEVDTVLTEYINVCDVPLLMRSMGYYPSEIELTNMANELHLRDEIKLGHSNTVITFDELVILYINYKPRIAMKIQDIKISFENMVLNDPFNNTNNNEKVITRESFVDMLINKGEKISFREMEILIHILSKTTDEISPGNKESLELILNTLPFTFTFNEMMKNLLGFENIDVNRLQ
ncbi:cilia- and flagella-associated protein 251-like [Daktulosphaira vitifoliae]|uniref:cilia- and flagella-associated protein 251-like n=1 Tax=Daktulosphaira vitifoliae TaxID=58002 RepID=UPI0021A9C490|nr:cilia- and flagella-associated protein 251-like [Daktulosphaira vitifoliae]